MEDQTRAATERVAREAYGRLVALLAVRTRDIAAAEDALADAFRIALETWPAAGIPDNPEAWLLTVGRRSHGHRRRHGRVEAAAASIQTMLADERHASIGAAVPDERLKLLFACAHPAIDVAARTPLMLQTVLGLDAARIAGAFATSPSAMAQRLVRAKAKIRDAGIRFAEPSADDLTPRLEAVIAAIYAAYGAGWDDGLQTGLAQEALFLGRLLVDLTGDQPEARGLLALMLYCEARRPARRTAAGEYTPLARQDTALWSRPMIREAEDQLAKASLAGLPGRFQTEAAIQSVHCQRAVTGQTNHEALIGLYDVLATQSPSLGVLIGRAAAYGAARGAQQGLALLAELPLERVRNHQPFWAASAHLLKAAGRAAEAAEAMQQAIGLADDPAVRAFLAAQR